VCVILEKSTTPIIATQNALVSTIISELSGSLATADRHIPRWLQIVDLGIGFAKTAEQNIELLKPENLIAIKSALRNRPLLMGPSRKKFLNSILAGSGSGLNNDDGDDILSRDCGTAGICCACILG